MDLGVLKDLGTGLVVMALAGALGFVLAVGCAVLLVQARRLAPALTVAGVGLAAAGGTLTGWVERLSWDPGDPGVMRIIVMTTAAARLLALLATVPVAGTFLLAAGFAGARQPPRRAPLAVGTLVVALLTAGVCVAGGFAVDDPPAAVVRGALYATMALLVGVSMSGADRPDGNAPEAGAAAAVAFPLLVAAGEGARRGLVELVMVTHGWATVEPALRAQVVESWYAAVADEAPWRWATVALACVVGLIGIAGNLQPGRRAGAIAALAWLGVALLISASGDVGPARMAALATASP